VLAECRALGAQVHAKELREQIAWSGEPVDPVASAAWRCHSDVVNAMPPLNTKDMAPPQQVPIRSILSGLHRDAASTQLDPEARNSAGILSPDDLQRHELSTSRGLEPTGTAVLHVQSLRDGLSHYEQGDAEGMSQWFSIVADAYVDAMSEALRISQSVLAGRTDPGLT